MAFFIATLVASVIGVMLLGSLLLRNRAHTLQLQADLDGTRQDLIRQLREAEHFRMACEDANDGIVIQTLDARVVWTNLAYSRIIGRPIDQIIGRNPMEFVFPEDDTPTPEEIRDFRYDPDDPTYDHLQLRLNRRADGSLFWNQHSISFRKSAVGEDHAILICRDVTPQIEQRERLKEARNRLAYEATHDNLTGLANRAAFLDFCEQALQRPAEETTFIGLLHVDLDRFKEINDTHGHSAGDAALIHVAQAMASSMPDTGLVGRVGGDEFVAVFPDIGSLDALRAKARTISTKVAEPFDWNDHRLTITCSIGAAAAEGGTTDPDTLLLQTDFALYKAKRSGRNRVRTYDERLHKRHTQETYRASELADAIDTASLDHVFQPTYDMRSGRVMGFETLVRWTHPEEGTIRPDEFLPIANELGLMGALDLGSMTSALERKHALDMAGFREMGIAFNASADLLAHPEFINRLVWGVEAGGIRRTDVTIEVLETTAFGDASETSSHAAVIRDLRDAGFQVHLDDFGVGYAGLAHLAQLAVTGVKIDRTLISNILLDETSFKIVRKIIELCNDLGLDVIAEGVETRDVADKLFSMGCQVIQGYWIARPLAEDAVLPWLQDRRTDGSHLRLISG